MWDKEHWRCSDGKGSSYLESVRCYICRSFHYFVHPLCTAPLGHIVSCLVVVWLFLHQHMAVRIYRAAANQSAPFKASLRCFRPIRDAEQDPCLRVVQRCSHVTLGKGMPTWTRGKDGMWVCSDNNTTEEKRKHQIKSHRRRSFPPPWLSQPHTVGRAKCPGFSRSDHPERRRSINRTFYDPAELETRGCLCRRSCVEADCHVVDGSSCTNTVREQFFCFGGPVVGSGLVFLAVRLWARQCGPWVPCALFVRCNVDPVRAATCAWRSDSSNKHPLTLHKQTGSMLPLYTDLFGPWFQIWSLRTW